MPRAPKITPAAAPQLAPSPHNLFTGTSGWAYPTWKPGFYPAELPTRGFLHFYAAHLTSVEVNYTFRTLPTAAQLEGWLASVPPGFRFSFKAPQRITHFARLRDCDDALDAFLDSLAPAASAGKLGPILFQLPPNFQADAPRLEAFLNTKPLRRRPALQLAFEFRHPSFFTDEIYAVLRAHNAALCIAESDDLATPDIATADFRCFRLRRHGGYKPAALKAFAARFTALAAEVPTFVYFKHEDEPTGALNAQSMLRYAAKLDPQLAAQLAAQLDPQLAAQLAGARKRGAA